MLIEKGLGPIMRSAMRAALLLCLLFLVTGCASQPPLTASPEATAPGFLHGLLHGFVSPFALIGSFFDGNVRMYAYPNDGPVYDVGFLLGLVVLTGGGSAARLTRRAPEQPAGIVTSETTPEPGRDAPV